jgi:hypothetical protein
MDVGVNLLHYAWFINYVVAESQIFFKFLPIIFQDDLRTAEFLQQFSASENLRFVRCFRQL